MIQLNCKKGLFSFSDLILREFVKVLTYRRFSFSAQALQIFLHFFLCEYNEK